MTSSESIHRLYGASTETVRASFGEDRERALDYYSGLIEFVRNISPPETLSNRTRLLDVGCGSGWSTFAFALAGYDALGIDLNAAAFESPVHEHCTLLLGSATSIPSPSSAFDLVVSYQCLEHISCPEEALNEMMRVCKPGGVIAVVGPNLVSPLPGLRYALSSASWRTLSWRRRRGMPRHPYGNTIPDIIAIALHRTIQLTEKLVRSSPRFILREPDPVPPFHSDNDACYLCNPLDLIAFFKCRGFRIEQRGKPGRLKLSYLFAGGTWVAARKPR